MTMQGNDITNCDPFGSPIGGILHQLVDSLYLKHAGNSVAARLFAYRTDRDISDLARSSFCEFDFYFVGMAELPF